MRDGYDPPLHPSTLALSEYPAAGSGRTAELTFNVTYMGAAGAPPAPPGAPSHQQWRTGGHPPVRLDVTGLEYSHLYRVTDITSNIGTAAPGVFEPYDHRTEGTAAEPGRTYTVAARIEFVAEGFVPVYARGLDGDIVTVDVVASEDRSMPYLDYLAMREDYLDHMLAAAGPADARERPLAAGAAPVPEKMHGAPRGAPSPPPQGGPLAGTGPPARPPFNATGTVVAEDYARDASMAVHGIMVCAYDLSTGGAGPVDTMLNTTAGEPACAYTGADGRYDILGIAGGDPHDATAADVFLKVVSRGYGGAITLVDYGSDGLYYMYVDDSDAASVELDYGGDLHVRHIDLDLAGAGMPGAARIISALSDGMAFFEGHGQAPANLTVKWSHMAGSSLFPDKPTNGAAYWPGMAVMWLDGRSVATDDDSADRHVILHELGHHVHASHDPGLAYSCPVHYYIYKYDERCAWGEGWAQLVPHLVYDSATLPYRTRGGEIDLEAGSLRAGPPGTTVYYSDTIDASGRPVGQAVEGSVAAAMWDLADGEAHPIFDAAPGFAAGPAGLDDAAAGPDAVISTFFSGTYDTFAEFYDRWEIDMRRHSAERVAVLHGMSFAIPNETPYYRFAGELDGVFDSGLGGLRFLPNYVDISADGSTAAVTSYRGQGMQLVGVRNGTNMGLHAAYGYDNACTLELDWRSCRNDQARRLAGLGPGLFSSMDGVAFDAAAGRVLVTDGNRDSVHAFGADGRHLGQFGGAGDGAGEFRRPDGVAFLPGGDAAVADAGNLRVQTFELGGGGAAARYTGEFRSQTPTHAPPYHTTQQLAAGPGGRLYAADYGHPSVWVYSPGPGGTLPGPALRIDDPSMRGLGGVAVDSGGLVYVSDHSGGRVRVYDPDNLRGDVVEYASVLGGLPLDVRTVRYGGEAFVDEFGSRGPYPWQLNFPLGVALGPPDAAFGDARVYVADLSGVKVYEKDRRRPAVTAVWSHTPDGTLAAGSGTAEIAVNFSERVTVEGEPVLALLGAGAPAAGATYASGSGSSTLTFNYTAPAGAGPWYLDYAGTGSLMLAAPAAGAAPEASIMDGSGNAADLELPPRGTPASLAANAALWIDPGGHPEPPVMIGPVPTAAAMEGRAVLIDAGAATAPGAANVSYAWIGSPAGAVAQAGGALLWTPAENQSGAHEFAVVATANGSAASHIRAVRVLVAEDNEPPAVEAIPDMRAAETAELRFDVAASDPDVPAQALRYGLEGDDVPQGAAVLPNGTFVWTPSVYDGGARAFNVSVSDGFEYGDARDDNRTGTAFAAFTVEVAEEPQPRPTVSRVSSYDRTYGAGDDVHISVEFSAPVVVRGLPGMGLDAGEGGPPALAVYDSGNLTSTLGFRYTVAHGHDSGRLAYAGTGALSDAVAADAAAGIWAASGEPAALGLPAPGSPGSLSSTSYVTVATTSPVLDVGVLYELASAGDIAYAARLSAGEFNAASPGVLLNITAYPYYASSYPHSGPAAADVLRLAHAGGGGPGVYVGHLGDRDLHGAMQYAAGRGIVLVSTDSTAPSLAAQGDRTFRLRPSDGLQADALARLAIRAGAGSVYAVLENASYGPAGRPDVPPPPGRFSHGFASALADSAVPPLGGTITMAGAGGRGAEAAAASLAEAVRSAAEPAAVVYLGSPAGLAALAARAAAYSDLRSAIWLASDSSAGSSLLAGSGPAAEFAALTGLAAAQWRTPESALTREIDSRMPHWLFGPLRPIYAAYDGVALLGAAAAAAGGTDAAGVAGRLHAAAAAYDGALGDIVLDPAGDLWVPAAYDVWQVAQAGQGGAAPEWVQRPGIDEARACSISLGTGSLDFGSVTPGLYTRPAPQTVINSGQLRFAAVELRATPWYGGSDGECREGGLPSLPTGLSEIRSEPGGAFAALTPTGTEVARGLEAGGEAPLWYRINLTGHADLPQTRMVQCVTYVAGC